MIFVFFIFLGVINFTVLANKRVNKKIIVIIKFYNFVLNLYDRKQIVRPLL